MVIGSIDTNDRVLIVAEIGNNHEGSFALAEELIGLAAEAGADAVKFQTFRTEHFVSRADAARFARLKSFELTFDQFERLAEAARRAGVLFLSTPLDLESARFLRDYVAAFKIASGDLTFLPLVREIAETGKPVILSTGLSRLCEVGKTKAVFDRTWRSGNSPGELALLHCVSAYPVPIDQLNLAAIRTLNDQFHCTVGYSDHALGIEAAVMSVAVGARIVEKHFTIRKDYSEFRDHQLSADPAEMDVMVQRIRSVESMLGDGARSPRVCEEPAIPLLRRSIAAAVDISADSLIEPHMLTWIRPASGIPAGNEDVVISRVAARSIATGQILTVDDLAPARTLCASQF